MKHYVIYARTASIEKSSENSLKYQVNVLKEFAKSNNLKVADVIQEHGLAKITYKTIEHVIAKNANGIICLSLDRLTRNFEEMLRIRRVLSKAHIAVLTPNSFSLDFAERHLVDAVLCGLSVSKSMEFGNKMRIKRRIKKKHSA